MLNDESRASQFSAEQLAKLWNIGADTPAEPAGPQEQRGDLLRDWMARPLPTAEDLKEFLPDALGQVGNELRPFSGDSIGSLILDPRTDVRVLEQIKDLAKRAGTTTSRETEKDAALAAYLAAIAAARVFHNAKISQHSDKKLRSAFAAMAKQTWMTPNLSELFKRACQLKGHEP